MLVLALDIGTSSARTALFDALADRLPGTTAQQSSPLITSAASRSAVEREKQRALEEQQ